jgi:uncharacterized membrane protein
MRPLGDFVKTTLLGGLTILLPLLLLFLLAAEVFGLLVSLATPLADLFPEGVLPVEEIPELVALFLLVITSFLLGVLVRSQWARGVGNWLEDRVLGRVPAYGAVKALSGGLLDAKANNSFKPALLTDGEGGGDPVYVIEQYADGKATVLMPWSPASFAGSLKVVDQSRLQPLAVSLDEYSRTIGLFGVGMGALLGRRIQIEESRGGE